MHSELCPVCQGKGEIKIEEPMPNNGKFSYGRKCHGCGGKGWIEVNNNTEVYNIDSPCCESLFYHELSNMTAPTD